MWYTVTQDEGQDCYGESQVNGLLVYEAGALVTSVRDKDQPTHGDCCSRTIFVVCVHKSLMGVVLVFLFP